MGALPRVISAVRRAVPLAVMLLPFGCGAGVPAGGPLAPYTTAELSAGTGLGNLHLDTTTLAPFVERFPGGTFSVVAGDEVGVDIWFAELRLGFLFVFEGECARQVAPVASRLLAQVRDTAAFFATYPACAATPLRSISAWAAPSPDATFFKGVTERGVALFTRRREVFERYGPGEDVRGRSISGDALAEDGLEDVAYGSGIVFSIGEALEGPDAGHLVVKKVAIFPPVQ
jgi:hypothetical protein